MFVLSEILQGYTEAVRHIDAPLPPVPLDANTLARIRQAVGRLPEIPQLYIRMRFGLGGMPEHSIGEIARRCSVAKWHVEATIDQTLRALRQDMEISLLVH